MAGRIIIIIASTIIFIWGVAHIIPVNSVVQGFGDISRDNQRIITMEWIAEGITLCFIAVLVTAVNILGNNHNTSLIVYRLSAGMLTVMAVLTLFTGAKTPIVPIKICPAVKTLVAILLVMGSIFK